MYLLLSRFNCNRVVVERNRVVDKRNRVFDERNLVVDERNRDVDERNRVIDERNRVVEGTRLVLRAASECRLRKRQCDRARKGETEGERRERARIREIKLKRDREG